MKKAERKQGSGPDPRLGKMRNWESPKGLMIAEFLQRFFFFLKPQSSPRKTGAVLGGDWGAVDPTLPFPPHAPDRKRPF